MLSQVLSLTIFGWPTQDFDCRVSSVYLLKMTSVYFLNITVLTDFEGIAERTETGSQLRFGSV